MTCENCGQLTNSLKYYKEKSGWCPPCFHADDTIITKSAMISIDTIVGGLEVKHGICWPDGTPKRYDSKSEIKRAAYEQGWSILGDTPKPNPRVSEQRAREAEMRNSGIAGLRSR